MWPRKKHYKQDFHGFAARLHLCENLVKNLTEISRMVAKKFIQMFAEK